MPEAPQNQRGLQPLWGAFPHLLHAGSASARACVSWTQASILLLMEMDRAAEWQRLTEVYREKYDEELLELAADSANLTEVAQRVLRDEIRRRKLGQDQPGSAAPGSSDSDSQGAVGLAGESGAPHEYTWKVALCECDEYAEAWQINEVLKRAGIESWIESPRSKFYWSCPRVVVAADRLDEARSVAERPIPQDIVDESRMEAPEFEPPVCPKCGAEDPLLESADPVNAWECEQCGAQWTDEIEKAE